MSELEKNFIVNAVDAFRSVNEISCIKYVSERSKQNVYKINGEECFSEELKLSLKSFVINSKLLHNILLDYQLENLLFNQLRHYLRLES